MTVENGDILLHGNRVGRYREKHNFYKDFLDDLNVDWRNRISKKYLPDAVIINDNEKVVFVVEKKYQASGGSVDEKLQTCDFKRKIFCSFRLGQELGQDLEPRRPAKTSKRWDRCKKRDGFFARISTLSRSEALRCFKAGLPKRCE
jgi:hypothetical protein